MKAKRIIAVLLCLCISFSAIPLQVFAAETTGETIEAESKPTNSLGQIGGYLIGNSMTTSNLFAEYKFSSPTGFGFAAERANNLIDQFKGLNSTVVGDDNLANGPDRMIINRDGSITWIQDKYGSTASSSVNLAFDDKTGLYRYMDGSGKPMQLEVPADQYDKAVDLMKTKISEGKVPGVTDPEEATNLIRKGHLTFKQAVNVAKAGTVESLVYDSAKGMITASCAAGIGFVLDYACCRLNGIDPEGSLKNAGLNGLKTGGVVFATYVISSQLAKTGLSNALIPTSEAIAKSLGKEVCDAIVLKTGVQTAGMSSTKAVAKIISKELIADGVLIIVLTGIDVVELFRGRISKEELLKNLTVTIVSVAVGAAGGYGGAALGSLIAPGAGTAIGGILGSLIAGGLSAWAAEALIAPYYESDAEEMFEIICTEFTTLCGEYLINEDEGVKITESLRSKLVGDVLKDMYSSEDRSKFARELLEPLFIKQVEKRPKITIPTEEQLRSEMKSTLHGVVFVH